MVARDRDDDLIRDRRDLQIAVYHVDLDVAVVGGRYREVARRQAHIVCADVRPLRGVLAGGFQRDGDRLAAHVRRVAGHALLGRVVHLARVVASDRDDDLGVVRLDSERAVHDHKLHVREVDALVLKVGRGNAHRVLADVRPLRRP